MERRPELTMMEDETGDCEKSIETLIAAVLSDIRQKGFSVIQPFSIGLVEERMIQFAAINGIQLASNEHLYGRAV